MITAINGLQAHDIVCTHYDQLYKWTTPSQQTVEFKEERWCDRIVQMRVSIGRRHHVLVEKLCQGNALLVSVNQYSIV